MQSETEYLVTAKSYESALRIAMLWGCEDANDIVDCSFVDFDVQVFGVMEKVLKVVHSMEKSGQKEDFLVTGIYDDSYMCSIFMIEYTGNEPLIKASGAYSDEDEEKYVLYTQEEFLDISKRVEEIPKWLKRNKYRTFKQAIKDELPLGGFLNIPYDQWVKNVLAECDE